MQAYQNAIDNFYQAINDASSLASGMPTSGGGQPGFSGGTGGSTSGWGGLSGAGAYGAPPPDPVYGA